MLKLPEGMNWYLAKLVYRIITGDGHHTPQFDVQFRLIRAEEPGWALEKANIIGRIGEASFANARNEPVSWKFMAVEDVSKISSLDDGEQLYGQIVEPDDAHEYLEVTRAKSRRLTDAGI